MVTEHVGALERALVGLLSVGMVFAPAVYASTSRLEWADYRLPPAAQRSAGLGGAVLMSLAVWLFWRSHADLGRRPRTQLVALAPASRGARDRHAGRIPVRPAPDVRLRAAVGSSAGFAAAELGCRPGDSCAVYAPVRIAGAAREADDARPVRRRVPRLHGPNGSHRSPSPVGAGASSGPGSARESRPHHADISPPDPLVRSSRRFPCPEASYRGDDLARSGHLVQYLVSTHLGRQLEVGWVKAGT